MFPLKVTEPFGDVALVIDNASPSTSVSLVKTSIITLLSSFTVPESGLAIGASFTALTVTDTEAESVPPFPSETV